MARQNPRNRNGHRRRRLRARVLAAYDTCALCGKPIDKSLPAGHPLAAEVDEILPVSLGGDPLDWHNVRLVHRVCNQRRGNGRKKRIETKNRLLSEPLPTSQPW